MHVIASAAVSLFLTQAPTGMEFNSTMTSQSVSFGQTAAPLGSGNAEVAMTPGFGYSSHSSPVPDGVDSGDAPTTSEIIVPAIEGNFAYGLTDTMNLNIHGSHSTVAGANATAIQPGVKINLMRGGFDLAVMPQIGFAWGSSTVKNEAADTEDKASGPGLLAGAKFIASHASGVYGGLGYDFSYQSLTVEPDGGTESEITFTGHNLNVGVGYNISMGAFQIRPELAFLYSAMVNADLGDAGELKDGSGWMVFPNISFAVGSGSPPATATASR